ncbi:testis-expressed protein 2 [Stigmatopora nigra]
MAESESLWVPGCEEDSRGGALGQKVVPNSLGTKRHLPRGIVIQLTGTEGEWSSLDESEPLFSLDHDEFYQESPSSRKDDGGLESQSFHVPLSPSSPGSLANLSTTGLGFLTPGSASSSPTHRPLASLVKSLSTELELKEGSTLRPKPLLSLVKSISTELSRSEPEVSQSKSDSRLNLHLLKHLTQPKNRSSGDSRTAPPSPNGDGLKGGFFKMELEDTKRKLSEKVQEPFSSMLNKIRKEDSAGSPKHQCKTTSGISRSLHRDASADTAASESPLKSGGRIEGDVFNWPSVKNLSKTCPVHRCKRLSDEDQGSYLDGDLAQLNSNVPPQKSSKLTSNPPPCMALFCVAVFSYGYLTLPLNSYFSGLAFGVAMGFFLGLMLIRMGSSRSLGSASSRLLLGEGILGRNLTELNTLKGWMNEVYEYDPETFQTLQTHSVFATLEGSHLRLDTPQSNIGRRATYDEKIGEAVFVKTRSYQLENGKVLLLPAILARKRIWNPKYPICIHLTGAVNSQEEATVLFLFGRTGREKEEWFRHFLLATTERGRDQPKDGRCPPPSGDPVLSQTISGDIPRSRVGSREDDSASASPTGDPSPLDYPVYMSRLLAMEESLPLSSPGGGSAETSPDLKGKCTCQQAESPAWLNAVIGRLFWDFLREKQWADAVSYKIQKKLSKIRLPYFMNELTLTELDMGFSVPQIVSTSRPEVNHRGLWVELQLAYHGTLQMTLQTKFNLSKLGKEAGEDGEWVTETGNTRSKPVLSVLADSDEESSSAGSSEDEDFFMSPPPGPSGPSPTIDGTGGGRTGKKILRFVDKIAKSKYFQKATETEFIKKKFEEMSNTPLLLTVEVQELSGSLVVNIPPPPTDRIWYSFCNPPKLDLRVRPKLGEREVTLCQVTEWIEKKLQDEFQKVFVLPNMDDIYFPTMRSDTDESSVPSFLPVPEFR